MRLPRWCVLPVLGALVVAPHAQVRADDFPISFAARARDAAGQFAGGTEMRLHGRAESGAWYLVRWPDGRYDLHQVAASFGHPLVAPRSILASPFPGEGGAVYFAGYDAIKAPAHNTVWIARALLPVVLGPSR
jgi:hypothetical protein